MTDINDLKTRAGLLLFRQLPEEYRFLDGPGPDAPPGEPGDLEAYLHGFGHLLDLIRGTTEQSYADAFGDPIDFPHQDIETNLEIQTWLLPYLADLVGAELLAPDPAQRNDELSNTVGWYKTKGTLGNADSIADTISGTETVTIEGWRRVLLTPRMKLPPFTAPKAARGDGDPLGASAMPLGTPDLRKANRAIVDPSGANPLYRLAFPTRDADGLPGAADVLYWKPRAYEGAPCFPNAYDDTSVRTPDLRNPADPAVGPHPRRLLLHVRPPYGFFEPGLRRVTLPATPNPLGFDLSGTGQFQEFGPEEVLKALGDPVGSDGDLLTPAPDKIVIDGDLAIPGEVMASFRDLLFLGRVEVVSNPAQPTRLKLSRSAVGRLVIGLPGDTPSVEADDCLFDEILSPSGFARLVHCTVMGETHLERVWASDCVFAGDLIDVICGGPKTCVRYSRIADVGALPGCDLGRNPHIVTDDPNFVRLWFDDPALAGCNLRSARYGEPGAGVLDLTTLPRIAAGAENGGEMGAYNHRFYSAGMAAVARKLVDFLPLGQDVSIRFDPHLARRPAAVA
ncbi:hypothetical protein LGR54_05525 [Ancylobacter sp. Lp-2]|uniref:hypothetical protein n=1 Tax=Ancylobacter sp. Lp-2 TaxID=2881339 RepID=UPI001E2FD407|nr:hypothetical protein [Ancylobacter sp. Lp-2]MCB4768056.1 hypothetical protein [Ancylobacter sp. Lp-2]